MGVLNTILVFVVYSLNFLMLVGAIITIFIFLSEDRQKDVIENLDINFEFLVFFSTAFIILAVIVALVSFFGCFGIAIDNDYLLILYIVALGVLMVAQLILSIWLRNKLVSSEEDIRNKILSWISHATQSAPNKLDGFQNKYSCCGIDSYRDWTNTTTGPGYIPGSCCKKLANATCPPATVLSTQGCKKPLFDAISKVLRVSIIVVFIIFGLEVILTISSILVLMDVGQTDEDNTSDEIVVVASIKKSMPRKKDDVKFEESIDTHDLPQKAIQSPITKKDDEQDEELHDAASNEDDDINEEETHEGDKSKDEVSDEEKSGDESREESSDRARSRKTHNEKIYLEGNIDKQGNEQTHVETGAIENTTEDNGHLIPIQGEEEDMEEEEEEEEGSEGIESQMRIEENINVSKSKFDKKNRGEKIRKERNRDRKKFK